MRKLFFYIAALLLLIPTASAFVAFSGFEGSTYNLGDAISASVNLSYDSTADALLGLRIMCPGYELQYYVSPVELASSNISAPAIKASAGMVGSCFLRANVDTLDKSFSDFRDSSQFSVTDIIPLTASISKTETLPGTKLVVSARTSPTYGEFSGQISIILDNEERSYTITSNDFSYLLEVGEKIKSGKHSVVVNVLDQFGNKGTSELEFSVIPIATDLQLSISGRSFKPKETISYQADMLDQAGDSMPATINLLFTGKSQELFSKSAQSGEQANYTFDNFLKPGIYKLEAASGSFNTYEEVTIAEVEEIGINFDNRTVTLTNLGNAPYNKDVELRLTAGDKNYLIIKHLSLKPNEADTIDLFQEGKVTGSYDVEVKAEGAETADYKNVPLEDQRSALKKVADATGTITGNLFGIDGKSSWFSTKPGIIVLAVIGFFLLAGLFSRGSKRMHFDAMNRKRSEFEAERTRAVLLERRKLQEAKRHKYSMDRSLRDREDIKNFVRVQQQRMKGRY